MRTTATATEASSQRTGCVTSASVAHVRLRQPPTPVDPATTDTDDGNNFNRYWYGNNNPYLFTDPDGRKGTFWLVKLCATGMAGVARLTRKEALLAARQRKDVLADSRRGAKRLTQQAKRGHGEVIEDPGHKLKDGSTGKPHFHMDRKGGHVFYTLVAIFAGHVATTAENTAQAAEIVDMVDPVSAMTHVGDAGPETECGSACRAKLPEAEQKRLRDIDLRLQGSTRIQRREPKQGAE